MSGSSHDSVAGQLRKLARQYETPELLVDLADALGGAARATPGQDRALSWATVNLQAAFLGGDSALRVRTGPGWKYVHGVLEVLVFVPIFTTWLGLILATSAYRNALSAGALGGESFLEGWQTGFGGRLPGVLDFGSLASVTVVAVGALMALTGDSVRRRLRAESVRSQLAAVLVKAELVLADYRLGAPERLARKLDLASTGLDQTVTAIAATGKMVAEVQQQAVDALSAITPALASLQNAASSVENVPDLLGGHLDQMSKALRSSISQVGQSVGQVGQALGDVALAQREVVSAGTEASAEITGVLTAGATRMREVLTDVSSTAAAYAYRVELAADVLGQTQEILNRFPDAIDGMTAAVSQLRGDVTSLRDRVSKVETAVSANRR